MALASIITPAVAILSDATRDAIEALGGLENAARVTSAGRSQLGRCQSANEGDTLSLRDAAAIDRTTLGRGGPHILRALAGLMDHAVVELPQGDAPASLTAGLHRILTELGEMSAALEQAGEECARPKDIGAAIAEVADLIDAACALRAGLVNRTEARGQ